MMLMPTKSLLSREYIDKDNIMELPHFSLHLRSDGPYKFSGIEKSYLCEFEEPLDPWLHYLVAKDRLHIGNKSYLRRITFRILLPIGGVQNRMASSSSFVSQEEFHIFHSIDRELYTILVMNLWRDPVESIQVMALWLWLEKLGFDNVVKKMTSLPYILINELADEAIICLNCIHRNLTSSSSENYDIPLLQVLVEKEISLPFFLDDRLNGIAGVAKIVNDVCIRAFSDIMQKAIERNAAQSLAESQMVMPSSIQQSLAVHSGLHLLGAAGGDLIHQQTSGNPEIPADDRTMFVTFSKGYPVQEWEVREFITRSYGDCIESLHMQEVQPQEQALFARIVFHKASAMEMILGGIGKVKFTINGKHVWARKFVPKRNKSSSLLPPLMPSHLPAGTSFRP